MDRLREEVRELVKASEVIHSLIAQKIVLSRDEIGVLHMCMTDLLGSLQKLQQPAVADNPSNSP